MWLSKTAAVAVSSCRQLAGLSSQRTWICFHRQYSSIDTSWKRSDRVPFPKVWRHCSGKMKLADSTVTQFRIQEVSEDMFDDTIEYMTNDLLNDEPMFVALGVRDDATSVRELQEIWREMLKQHVSLVVVVDDHAGRPKVVGCNILGVVSKHSQATHQQVQGKALQRLLAVLDHVDRQTNVFSRYGVSHYLTGFGLCIARAYRGQGLGKELLHARLDMCRALSLPLTVTLFSGPASQAVAHTLGMDLLVDLPYEQYQPGGKLEFSGATGAMKLMAKKIQL